MTEKKSADSKKAEGAANKATATDVAASKKTAAKAAPAKAAPAKAATKANSAAADAGKATTASGTTAKIGDTKSSKAKAAPLSAAQKSAADDSIKSKKSIDDLKARAAAAKKRAQEKILEKSYVSDPPADPLERLANTFDNSARRWEMVVYPSLFAFVLLAGYGFFLIYRLTHDIATLSQSVTHMAVIVSDAMPRMTKDLNLMTDSVDNMSGDIGGMTVEISSMSGQMNSLTPMSKNIQSMTSNLGSMNRSVYGMQRDMHGMNRTVSSGPFGMMNDIMPFSSDTNVPPQMGPPQVWPSYNPVPQQNQMYARPPAPQQRIQHNAAPPRSGQPKAISKTAPAKTQSPEKTTGSVNTKRPTAVEMNNVKTEVTMPGASPVILKK